MLIHPMDVIILKGSREGSPFSICVLGIKSSMYHKNSDTILTTTLLDKMVIFSIK